ncbi:MAG: uroporphyrinogen-III synthase [Hyphomicrobiaceae bacterium]
MHVLVTRPEPDSIKLVGLLQKRGHTAQAAPLSTFVPLGLEADALEGVTGLIATSRNALRAIVGSDALVGARMLTLFAVGAATAEDARRMGFATIVKGPGTAAELGPLIASLVDPAEDLLLHLAGERMAHDLASELGQLGVRADRRVVYRMDAATALSGQVLEAIRGGHVDAVALMSPDAATIWTRLVAAHGLERAIGNVVHVCLSSAVARRLAPIKGVAIACAGRPTLEEMLALIDLTAANIGD